MAMRGIPGRGMNAVMPGRNSTYFNSPYMGQIADNLSSAIYGNPQDELTREQIKNAQAGRARQVEQDALTATALSDKKALNKQFGGAVAAAMIAPDDKRQMLLSDALRIGSENGMDLRDMSSIMPYSGNQQWAGKKALQDVATEADINAAGVRNNQELAIQSNKFGQETKENNLDRGQEIKLDLLGGAFGMQDRYTAEGYRSPTVEGKIQELLGIGDLSPLEVLPMNDPSSAMYDGGSGSGSGSGSKKITGADVKNYEEVIYNVTGLTPESPGYVEFLTDAFNKYGSTSNPAAAIGMALEGWDIVEGNDSNLWSGTVGNKPFFDTKGSAKKKAARIKYDANGNRVE